MSPDPYQKQGDKKGAMALVKAPPIPENTVALVDDIKVKTGQWINKGQLVIVLKTKDKNNQDPKDFKTRRIKSEASGTVLEICVKKGEEAKADSILARISLTGCPHSTIMKNMCADCGADLENEEQKQDKQNQIAMIHSIPELKVSTVEAESLGREDERRLLSNRRLVLLVDLDQTLIHTTNDNIPPNIQDVKHFQLGGPQSPWYHTRIRPKTSQFLKSISQYYELHIFTYGARLYAHTVAKFLDQDSQLFSHRILSRDECFDSRLKTANLPSLFPCGDQMVCIIDDREDVWNFAPNLVHVKPYIFFKNVGDINAPEKLESSKENSNETLKKNSGKDVTSQEIDAKPKSTSNTKSKESLTEESDLSEKSGLENDFDEFEPKKGEEVKQNKNTVIEDDIKYKTDTDDYLLHLEDILKNIHQSYYNDYDQMKDSGKIPDLKDTIPKVKKGSLKGISIVFSGIVPTGEQLERSKACLVARSLGAEVSEKITSKTTHLVAARTGTAKVNEARKRAKNVYLVTADWLWGCAERWERIDERLYPLCKSVVITVKPPAHCSSPEDNASDRIQDYGGESSNLNERSKEADRQSANESLPESYNPFCTLSTEDFQEMDKEVADILSSESSLSSSTEDDETPDREMPRKFHAKLDKFSVNSPKSKEYVNKNQVHVSQSSNSEIKSLKGTNLRCLKRKSVADDVSDENEAESGTTKKFAGLDLAKQFNQSQITTDYFEADPDSEEDDEIDSAMAKQCEREFMEEESLSD